MRLFRRLTALIVISTLGLMTPVAESALVSVKNMRLWRAPDHTRIVFDLSGPIEHHIFTLSQPERVVIDIKAARLGADLPRLDFDGPVIRGVRTGKQGVDLRIVLDLKMPSKPQVLVLKPFGAYGYRLVIDFDHEPERSVAAPDAGEAADARVQAGTVVQPELSTAEATKNSPTGHQPPAGVDPIAMPPVHEYWQLLVRKDDDPIADQSMQDATKKAASQAATQRQDAPRAAVPESIAPVESVTRTATSGAQREIVIAIDAGHGGEDPGAIGRRYRTREKHVVLAIAKLLAQMVDREPGMRAVLVRKGDYFISLGKRRQIAHDAGAQLFLSIHADSMPGRNGHRVRGASIYAVSERGASSSFARILAERENSSDQVGGVRLTHRDPVVQNVLMDLSLTTQIISSVELGRDLLYALGRVGPLHSVRVAQAGFAVLKSPDIPSVLVETAFISNPSDEKRLRSSAFQRKMAQGILAGIKRYLSRKGMGQNPVVASADPDYRPPSRPQTSARARYHRVRRGDTLSAIALQYRVSVQAIRRKNGLRSDQLRIGMRLRIP